MLTILSLILLLNFILPFLDHPLLLTILMVIESLLISLPMSLINSSSWFSYILFLSFLGGMLLLFNYMTTLTAVCLFVCLVICYCTMHSHMHHSTEAKLL